MLYQKRIEEKVLSGKVIKVCIEYISGDNIHTGTVHGKNFSVYTKEADFSQADISDGQNLYYMWNYEPSIFWLVVAMFVFQTTAIFVPAYGWVFWNHSLGFYGSGYEYFRSK